MNFSPFDEGSSKFEDVFPMYFNQSNETPKGLHRPALYSGRDWDMDDYYDEDDDSFDDDGRNGDTLSKSEKQEIIQLVETYLQYKQRKKGNGRGGGGRGRGGPRIQSEKMKVKDTGDLMDDEEEEEERERGKSKHQRLRDMERKKRYRKRVHGISDLPKDPFPFSLDPFDDGTSPGNDDRDDEFNHQLGRPEVFVSGKGRRLKDGKMTKGASMYETLVAGLKSPDPFLIGSIVLLFLGVYFGVKEGFKIGYKRAKREEEAKRKERNNNEQKQYYLVQVQD